MKVTASTQAPAKSTLDLLALPLAAFDPEQGRLPARYAACDRLAGGRIAEALASGDFRGKAGESLLLYAGEDAPFKRVLLLGLGEDKSLDAEVARQVAGSTIQAALAKKAVRVTLALPSGRRLKAAAAAQAAAEGAVLAGYRFDAYKEKPKEPAPEPELTLWVDKAGDLRAARKGLKTGVILGESQNLARRLSNEPGNAMPPAAMAQEARKVAREVGLKATVFGVPELEKRKMGAILAVGQGSANPPRMAILEHQPKRSRRVPTVCLVGKGVTFDSGGISIKPGAGMDEMKHDMSGAAAVVGAMRAVALLDLPLHVVGIIGCAENMPSGTAYRPGDIVRTAAGVTVEVLNTDAEGRLVLADALHHAITEYEPDAIIDFATLTGACVIALGSWCSGAFSNDDKLVEQVRRAGEETAERVWPMPLWDGHKDAIKSPVADIKNVGGREAGSATAAAFLARFVGDTPWVHLDIAGTGWTSKPGPYQGKGATGVGVRLSLAWLQDFRSA